MAEVIPGHCTYEGGYFDIKYKTKAILQQSALHASEPTRNAYVKAQVIYTTDAEIEQIVPRISAYPEHEVKDKIACFNANLQLNRGYFLQCVPESNAYMRAHLADEIVYSVYRLILIETACSSPATAGWKRRWKSAAAARRTILRLGAKFLREITAENCEAFVQAFWKQTSLPLSEDVSENCSQYVYIMKIGGCASAPPSPTSGERRRHCKHLRQTADKTAPAAVRIAKSAGIAKAEEPHDTFLPDDSGC